jgi:hypothetical protein
MDKVTLAYDQMIKDIEQGIEFPIEHENAAVKHNLNNNQKN